MSLLEKWNQKKMLCSDDIHNSYHLLEKINIQKNPSTQNVLVESLTLHAQRQTEDEENLNSKFKNTMNKLKCDQPSTNFVYFTLFNNKHWSVAILNKKSNTIKHYDSVPGANKDEFELLKKRLESIGLLINHEDNSEEQWFTQKKNWECGYFAIFSIWVTMFNNKFVQKDQLKKIQTPELLYDSIKDMLTLIERYTRITETLKEHYHDDKSGIAQNELQNQSSEHNIEEKIDDSITEEKKAKKIKSTQTKKKKPDTESSPSKIEEKSQHSGTEVVKLKNEDEPHPSEKKRKVEKTSLKKKKKETED